MLVHCRYNVVPVPLEVSSSPRRDSRSVVLPDPVGPLTII
jgi:hypothetical protein